MNFSLANILSFRTALWLMICLGGVAGLGLYTLHYAEGLSYLSSDPRVCVNCHIMRPQFDSWQKSGHHHVATCVECHLPHSFVAKYIAKAENGYYHAKGFTFQNFHEPIQIKEKNARILQANCVLCHKDIVEGLRPEGRHSRRDLNCVHCHATVGHGPRAGLGGFYSAKELRGEIP